MNTVSSSESIGRRKRIRNAMVFCACVLLATFAAAITINNEATVVMHPNAPQAVLVLGVSLFLFQPVLRGSVSRISPIIVCVAMLFSLFTVLGLRLNAEAHTLVLREAVIGTFSTSSKLTSIAIMFVGFIGFALLYYAAVTFAYAKLDGLSMTQSRQRPCLLGRPLDYRFCIIVLSVAWLPYLVYYFPGTVSADMSHHLAQFFGTNGLAIDTHFPYLVALVFGGVYQLGCFVDPNGYVGIFLMVAVQVALGLFAFSSVVIWLSRMSRRRTLAIGALAFFALFPLIPAHMVLIDKDTLHAELIVFLTLQIMLLFQAESENIQRSPLFSPVAIGIVALFVALTRNNGIILVAVALLVTALLLKHERLWAVLGSVLALFCLWQFALVPQMGVVSSGSQEALSMPAQVIAAHVADDLSLTEAERATVQNSFDCDLDTLAQRYDPLIADKVKSRLIVDSPNALEDFLMLAVDLTAKNPVHGLSAALATTYGTWYPFCYGTYHSEDVPYVNAPGDTWANPEWFSSFQDLPSMNERVALGNKALHGLHYVPGFALLYVPGTYLWFIIFVLGYSLYAKQDHRQTASVLALFFALALVMVFGPCSSLRYAFPFVFSLPLFVALLVDCRRTSS